VEYRWQVAKLINCILKFCLYLPNLPKENKDLFWLTVYLSWSFVVTRCNVLIWLTKILMRTMLNVYVGRRFPTPASGETDPVSSFNLMTRLTVARLTPTTAEISLFVLAVCSCIVMIFVRFLGVASISTGGWFVNILQLIQDIKFITSDAISADAMLPSANW